MDRDNNGCDSRIERTIALRKHDLPKGAFTCQVWTVYTYTTPTNSGYDGDTESDDGKRKIARKKLKSLSPAHSDLK